LGTYPTALRAIVDFELNEIDPRLLFGSELFPLGPQRIHNKITGFIRTPERDVELSGILIHDPAGNVFFLAPQVMVAGPMIAPGLAPTRIIANIYRRFAVHAQAFHPSEFAR
jgi:hypothetical protein